MEEGKAPVEEPVKVDVIRVLLEHDQELLKRDLESRLFKLLLWKKQKKKYEPEGDEGEEAETFTWWKHEDDQIYYAMGAKYKTGYRKGD